MAIGVHFDHPEATIDQYWESWKILEEQGLGAPDGRLYHFAFTSESKPVQILSVWDSQHAIDDFVARLHRAVADTGVEPIFPEISEVVNIVVGPGGETAKAAL
jgi:hypothetical protein